MRLPLIRSLSPNLRQTLLYAVALAGAKGVSLAMVPVFTHHLSPADYARLDVLQTLADLVSILVGFGLADTLFRFAGSAKDPETARKISARLLGMGMLSAALFLAVGQLSAPWIAAALPAGVSELEARLILASLAFSAVILVPLAWMRMTGRAGAYLIGSLGRAILQAGLAAGFLSLGFGLSGVLTAGLISCLLLAATAVWIQTRMTRLSMPESGQSIEYLRYGGPLMIAAIGAFLLNGCGRWILAAEISAETMATYALAAKFGLMTAALIQPVEMWWLAKRFSMLNGPGGTAQCGRAARIGLLSCIAAALIVCAIGPVLVTWLTPTAYHGAIQWIPWLAAAAALNSGVCFVNLGLHANKTTTRPMTIDLSCAALALVLYLLLIPAWGTLGAATATITAMAVRFSATWVLAQRHTPLPMLLPLRPAASG